MKRSFRNITDTDYKVISEVLGKELKKYSWADKVTVRSWCIDECNKLGIQWWGKENEQVIPTLVDMVFKEASRKTFANVVVFNLGTQKRQVKKFRSVSEADKFFEDRKRKSNLVCEPREKYFTYLTELGNKIMVQKMY